MTDRTRDQIAYYLPHDPDPTLEENEYYYLQYTNGATGNPRVIRVYALDILPHKDGVEYGLYQMKGARLQRVDTGWGNPSRGAPMGDLYDNKQDCKDQTHGAVSWWQGLREEQKKEANYER